MQSSLVQTREESYKIDPSQFHVSRLLETDDYVFMSGVFNRFFSYIFYKKNENLTNGIMYSLLNDIDGGLTFWPRYKFSDNKLALSIFPYQLVEYLAKERVDYYNKIDLITQGVAFI
jgi:hypothetical protein